MPEFILPMHNDVNDRAIANDGQLWSAYIANLKATGGFNGGSSIGIGVRLKKSLGSAPSDLSIEGFVRVNAESLEAAQKFVVGNPNYEAGGTVEIRELPQDE